jgi:hypothetical protein
MKKLIALIVIVLIIYEVYSMRPKKEDTVEVNDLEIIQQVNEACQKIALSKEVQSLGDAGAWHIFDLELIYQKEGECYEAFVSLLGDDFNTVLSTGDRLFVGFLPYRQSYRIYAGDPNNKANMLYPDWNYSKISPENK